ncbi:MAG: amidohydrolase family protein [Planctomycetaceae bacterium]|nr:amidohydrolase family protein [Planctomycetales bacterium]MCB9923619.1 amidohydrolase family protein [Planctomycetaceae bacterium]
MSLSRVCRYTLPAIFFVVLLKSHAAPPTTLPVEGLRQNTPRVHALTGARIVVAPGRTIDNGTVVIRDGIIEAAGDVKAPADARLWNLEGKTVYAGLIDSYGEIAISSDVTKSGTPYWNSLITPQLAIADHYQADSESNKKLRNQGVTTRLVAPSRGIIKGTSSLVLTGDDSNRETIVHDRVAQHLRLTVSPGRGRETYPNSPMGAVALARQAMLDADWYGDAWAAYRSNTTLPRPERNDALDTLQAYPDSSHLVIADASNELFVLRADEYARQFSLNIVIRGSGHEYKRLDAITATGRSVILPLNFPKPPNVASAETALNVDLDDLMHWDIAPENAARLDHAGVPIAFTSHGLKDQSGFLKAVRKAVERGLSNDSALRALTTTPARMFGADDKLGTIERGKIANLVVTDGDLFAEKTKVVETWINGTRYEVAVTPEFDIRGDWKLNIAGEKRHVEMELTGDGDRLSGEIEIESEEEEDTDENEGKEIKLSRVGFRDARFSCTFEASGLLGQGVARLTAVVSFPKNGPATWLGHVTLADGSRRSVMATRIEEDDEEAEDNEGKDRKKPDAKEPVAASFDVNYPLGAFGREKPPKRPKTVLFKNATVWTCGKAGTVENASVLVVNGHIRAVGKEIAVPKGGIVIDATGKHITPGIIDCHSHMATDGGINESTQAITAEVRIGDFIDADDIAIYRQLAGGVTTANILHGSANPIGGQNQVIKLRWGALPNALKFSQAPQGIKFALGENVKQSNWGDEYTTRYPQTRMGVEQIMRDAFHAAQAYRAEWEEWRQTRRGLPPRVDLELEAIAEIVEGARWIHCHSYRQDEILALIRTLDEFNIRIGTFQHILEGYKVADAMAKHGAMGSAFSDWWAYKFEVYDAIPYAGALMHNAGVNVSFNSDDRELARHLNQEAAKAVKYGGVPPEEALKFVTLNPAKQLRIEKYVGSLEPGKHADFVVWSGPPLSNFSRCEQTWIDGRRYFDVEDDRKSRDEELRRRNVLVQKILASGEKMKEDGEIEKEESELWPRDDLFCHGHDHGSHE